MTKQHDLRWLLESANDTDGTKERKDLCLGAAQTHIKASIHLIQTFKPTHVAVLHLEYATLQIGNAIALVYDRLIENKEQSGSTHTLAADIITAYCEIYFPELLELEF